MRSIREAIALGSREEIKKEIEERKKIISEMFGDLYPSILMDEIFQLQRLIQ